MFPSNFFALDGVRIGGLLDHYFSNQSFVFSVWHSNNNNSEKQEEEAGDDDDEDDVGKCYYYCLFFNKNQKIENWKNTDAEFDREIKMLDELERQKVRKKFWSFIGKWKWNYDFFSVKREALEKEKEKRRQELVCFVKWWFSIWFRLCLVRRKQLKMPRRLLPMVRDNIWCFNCLMIFRLERGRIAREKEALIDKMTAGDTKLLFDWLIDWLIDSLKLDLFIDYDKEQAAKKRDRANTANKVRIIFSFCCFIYFILIVSHFRSTKNTKVFLFLF